MRPFFEIGLLTVGVVVLALFLCPVNTQNLNSHSRPSQSFQESLTRIERLHNEALAKDVHPEAYPIVMHHDRLTKKVIVFFSWIYQ